ncbi:MFS multidrug transporter [Aspergillus luchuensis]|uniref:MFS multidrug transporter n=1 Tax=Aspergillus kawachii TaxID=1069201 RepID=A0A146F1S3_ASPKA|nr:MFS multidrug transporter [Aspergillus luchuensis]
MLGLARLGLLVLHVMLCLYSVKLSLSMMELAARSTEKPINKPLERHIMTSAVAKKISASRLETPKWIGYQVILGLEVGFALQSAFGQARQCSPASVALGASIIMFSRIL